MPDGKSLVESVIYFLASPRDSSEQTPQNEADRKPHETFRTCVLLKDTDGKIWEFN